MRPPGHRLPWESMVKTRIHEEHRHLVVKVHALRPRGGVPYEVEREVCRACGRVLAERPLRRAAA
jgi:hypothetical protein